MQNDNQIELATKSENIFTKTVFKYLDFLTLSRWKPVSKNWKSIIEDEIQQKVHIEKQEKYKKPTTDIILQSIHIAVIKLFYAYIFKFIALNKASIAELENIDFLSKISKEIPRLRASLNYLEPTTGKYVDAIQDIPIKLKNRQHILSLADKYSSGTPFHELDFRGIEGVEQSTLQNLAHGLDIEIFKNINNEMDSNSFLEIKTNINFSNSFSGSTNEGYDLFIHEFLLNIRSISAKGCHAALNISKINKIIHNLENHLDCLLKTSVDINIYSWEHGAILLRLLNDYERIQTILPESQNLSPIVMEAVKVILKLLLSNKLSLCIQSSSLDASATKRRSSNFLTVLIEHNHIKLAIELARLAPDIIPTKDQFERTALEKTIELFCSKICYCEDDEIKNLYYQLIETLIENNPSPALQDTNGNNCLHKFCNGVDGRMKISKHLQILLNKFMVFNIDINLPNFNGNTALHFAVRNGNSEAVQLLLAHGADPGISNQEGKTPLDIAHEYNDIPLISCLQAQLDKINQEREAQMPSFMRSLGRNYFE